MKINDIEYDVSETYKRTGSNFTLEVKHWTSGCQELNILNHVWNLYVYIYEKHPLFNKLENTKFLLTDFPCMPGGVTYVKWHGDHDSDIIHCKQYGNDYSHIWNCGSDHWATIDDAYEVFTDATEVFNFLENYES